MPRFERTEILKKFRAMAARGEPIVGGGAGTGLSAKCEEAGGVDLIVIYNSGRYRMAGRGSLAGLMPYGDANAIELANECSRLAPCASLARSRRGGHRRCRPVRYVRRTSRSRRRPKAGRA